MSYLNNLLSAIKGANPPSKTLAAKESTDSKASKRRLLPTVEKSIFMTRQDISNWKIAINQFNSAEDTKNWRLQLLLNDISLDALLTSQIENRKQQLFTCEFTLKKPNGEIDEEQTELLKKSTFYRGLTTASLDKKYLGYSAVELVWENDKLRVKNIPRTNIVPQTGKFYKDYTDDTGSLEYRTLPEFGTWVLEFLSDDLMGLLNKAVPHVLFKKFAQSCWSELCEIYGIPPRYMKTDTTDPSALKRAEKMMADMGAAAWFIIDDTEEFEFADGVTTTGDVYNNLIRLCDNQISLLISGAVIGQDTKHGSFNKDQSSQDVLWLLVQSDMESVESDWNTIILPALQKIGVLKGDLTFEFSPAEDIKQLFDFVKGLLPYKDIADDWIKDKFGVEVIGNRQSLIQPADEKKDEQKNNNLSADFFM